MDTHAEGPRLIDADGTQPRGYEGFQGVVAPRSSQSEPWYPAPRRAHEKAPNVVVILIDDMGFSDIAPFGSEIPTPALDALADEGYRLTNFHVAPVCSPTRAALLTGCNPHRAGVGSVANMNPGYPGIRGALPQDMPTLAETFRENGYATLMVGKWHLTPESSMHDGADKSTWPIQRGFDRYFGSLEGFAYPLSVARAVLARLPHELLVGAGAARFAAEIGAERTAGNPPEVEQAWRAVLDREGTSMDALHSDPSLPLAELVHAATDPERVRDTTVYLAQDTTGNLCSGVSTSGWAWKYPGRLGDSPIIGAGSYADRRYGAAACTHTGEMTIRAGTARAVVLYLKMGLGLEDALAEAGHDLDHLDGGQQGTVVIHAVDAKGGHRVAAHRPDGPLHYWIWTPGMPEPERRVVAAL